MTTKREALTNVKQVKAIKPGTKPYVQNIKDSRGLYIKVLPSGKKHWYYRARVGDKFEWMKLGEFTDTPSGMSLAEAREEVNENRKLVKKHGSAKQFLRDEKAQAIAKRMTAKRQADKDAYTVEIMCREYVDAASREIKKWHQVDLSLKKNVIPVLGEMPVRDVTRKDVVAMLDKLNKRGKPIMANRTLSYLKRCFNWAINSDRLDVQNPCNRIEMNKEQSKDRALADTEIKRLIQNLPKTDLTQSDQDLLLFVLLTAMRPGEAAGVSFDQLDEEAATITLTNTKNGTTHIVPLSPPALAIALKHKGESQWLFPRKNDSTRCISTNQVQKPLRNALPHLKVMKFTPHDLRRTMATGLAKMGCPFVVISVALNHTISGGVTAIYNRYSYSDELKEWYEKWGAHVEALAGKPAELRKVG